MSIIAGILHFDGGPAERSHVEAMTSWMAERAPDGISHWQGSGAALGAGLLRTTPESLEEAQPMTSENGNLVLVMDGRVDNWEDLRASLLESGKTLRTRSDAKLVLRAYEHWGEDCLDHIDGDFSLVIWDVRNHRAFCARDRFGVKPFYYHCDGKVFSFATELRPLLDLPWVPKVFNEGMAAEFLGANWSSVDETFWQGIMRLPPNTRMTVDAKGRSIESYWHPDVTIHDPPLSDEDYVTRYRKLLTDAVRRLSRSHKPVACEVSGGLDSSAVFALAEHLRRDGKLPAPGLQGYTLYFDPQSEANDLPYARAVGELLGRSIAEIKPTVRPLSWSKALAEREADFPSYPNGIMGLGIRQSAASHGARALLAGIGADEQLSSGRTYYADALRRLDFREFLGAIRGDAAEAGLGRALYWSLRHGVYRILPESVRKTLTPLLHLRWLEGRYRYRKWLSVTTRSLLERRPALIVIANEPLASLLHPYGVWAREKENQMAERAGVELRYPFFDRRLIEFTARMPANQRIRGQFNKYVHRKAMAMILPSELCNRQDKANFMGAFQKAMPDIITWLAQNREAAHIDDFVCWEELKKTSKHLQSKDFGGWPEFMLWTIFGCGLLARQHLASQEYDTKSME